MDTSAAVHAPTEPSNVPFWSCFAVSVPCGSGGPHCMAAIATGFTWLNGHSPALRQLPSCQKRKHTPRGGSLHPITRTSPGMEEKGWPKRASLEPVEALPVSPSHFREGTLA